MGWFKKAPAKDSEKGKLNITEGMWVKCPFCRGTVYRKEVDKNGKLCPKCEYHFPLSVTERIEMLLDPESFQEWETDLSPADPLTFVDTQPYVDRLTLYQEKTGRKDGMVIGEDVVGNILNSQVCVVVLSKLKNFAKIPASKCMPVVDDFSNHVFSSN